MTDNQNVDDAANRPIVLVVDDEPSICWGFERLLGDQGFRVIAASSAEEGLHHASENSVSLVLLDVRLPGEDGLSALPKFRDATRDAPIIVMTAFGDLPTAVAAVQGGAIDYLTKPFSLDAAARACQQAMRRAADQPDQASPSETSLPDDSSATMLVGRSSAMQQVFRQIALVADSDLSVLITGETGTGKELVAAAIHRHSRRSAAPYLALAPATLSESVIESELFGHVRGSFTGASQDRKGLFELASGGSVLLDEIGDLNRGTQVKLLRVIESGEFTAVGDVRPRKCDVRVIAATNRDLQAAVADGSFREDLLYRLAAVSIRLPPLRQRTDDIPSLCEYFLRRLSYPVNSATIDRELTDHLCARPWYGNVRELRNAVEHASVIARGRRLSPEDFPPAQPIHGSANVSHSMDEMIQQWTRGQLEAEHATNEGKLNDLHERLLATTEPAMFRVVLEHTGGNRAAAAQILGMHRGTLRDRMKRYGDDSAEASDDIG